MQRRCSAARFAVDAITNRFIGSAAIACGFDSRAINQAPTCGLLAVNLIEQQGRSACVERSAHP